MNKILNLQDRKRIRMNTVTKEHIEKIMSDSKVEVQTIGDKTTFVCVTLPNGFVLTHSSSCVDPKNYNKEIGKEICLEKIKDKIWELEGYLLQQESSQNKKEKVISKTILMITGIAKVAYEVNRAYCQSIGDSTQPSWEDAPEWQKNSIINWVRFRIEHPEASTSSSHES